ncbi:TetR/AcrR family transcriptional regulator [Actinocrispum sp. NPDC049592]|uniref:TetR/AcrR family transcriptional regulator n=1 Tax=Actinocrispum sp. NPDC049592 TaxID=3154835 RepID=UPI00343A397D
MARVSPEEAARHREQVVTAAARLFREKGVQGVGVAELMADVGLTHGGFYRQFASKEALAAEAVGRAYGELSAFLDSVAARHPGDRDAARTELIEFYLSERHRDDPGTGCATAALSGEMAHEAPDSDAHQAFREGVAGFIDGLGEFIPDRRERITTFCTMLGGLVLARALGDTPMSDEILTTARESALDDE